MLILVINYTLKSLILIHNLHIEFPKMSVDNVYVGAGASVGVELFRIEKMAPVKLTSVDGCLFDGDCYILLNTFRKSPTSRSLSWNIHFWLGSESSADEQGVAAYKVILFYCITI